MKPRRAIVRMLAVAPVLIGIAGCEKRIREAHSEQTGNVEAAASPRDAERAPLHETPHRRDPLGVA